MLVEIVSFPSLVVDEDDEEEDVPDDGLSSPAVSVVCRGVGEDDSIWRSCCDVDDDVALELGGWAEPSLLSIAELISSRRKRLKSPLINSLSSFLF